MRQVRPAPTPGERDAHERLFRVAIALVSANRGDAFPVEDAALEEFIAAGREVCPRLSVVRPGGKWPAEMLDTVAVLVTADGSAMLLMTEMLRPGAFEDSSEPPVPNTEFLAVDKSGRSQLASGDLVNPLLGLARERYTRD